MSPRRRSLYAGTTGTRAGPAGKLSRASQLGLPELVEFFLPPGFFHVDTSVTVVRPQDLLVLSIDRINLQLDTSGDTPRLVAGSAGDGFLVIEFPPQNIVEQAYFESAGNDNLTPKPRVLTAQEIDELTADELGTLTDQLAKAEKDGGTGEQNPDDPPIPARIAKSSRLVFRVREEDLPIDFTLGAILDKLAELQLSVPNNALEPAAREISHLMGATPFPNTVAEIDVSMVRASSGVQGTLRAARALRKARLVEHTVGPWMTIASQDGVSTDLAVAEPFPGFTWLRPVPQPPSPQQTAIELPYRLIVSPTVAGTWFHSTDPGFSDETERTELWHTRLGVVVKGSAGVSRTEDPRPERVIRAVWTRDDPPPETPDPASGEDVIPAHEPHLPFRASLEAFDRHNIVHLSSNFQLKEAGKGPPRAYEPQPIAVQNLILSSLGGWLDARGAWDFPQPWGLSVEEWRHRATMGRDHYVRVVYSGHLLPFGHRCSLVKVTERKIHEDRPGDPAYLRQRMFLVVREPIRAYLNTGWKQGPVHLDQMWPFETVRITNLVSPDLDDPAMHGVGTLGQQAFWPYVGTHPHLFDVVATDLAGNTIELSVPAIFVEKELTDGAYTLGVDDAVVAYGDLNSGGQVVPAFGQVIAFAPPSQGNDTSFAVDSLTIGTGVPDDPAYTSLEWTLPRYLPIVRKTSIHVPAMERIARSSQAASVVYAKDYLEQDGGFTPNNAGEVFLAADGDPTLKVSFSTQGDRSGGLMQPDLSLGGLSRITGPVSGKDLTAAVAGSFDPKAWFGDILEARLFGAFRLADVLDTSVLFDEIEKVPRFVGGDTNLVEKLLSDLDQLVLDASALGAGAWQSLHDDVDAFAATVGSGALPAQLPASVGALESNPPGGPGQQGLIGQRLAAVQAAFDGCQALVAAGEDLAGALSGGSDLPQIGSGRLEWRPQLVADPDQIFSPGSMVLSVEATDAFDGVGEGRFTVTAALEGFGLDLGVIALNFGHVVLSMRDGAKPDVDVVFEDDGIDFKNELEFVDTLRNLIPFDGFSDPPGIQVTPEGIEAGFTMGLPDLSVGVFTLQNLSLGAGFAVPFVGPPMSVWFRFCERENPATLTVMCFGGGGFLGVTVNADGLHILEAALEFGAAIAVNFGVAAGGVSAMGGIYFKIEGGDVSLTGYFRLRGEVEALGIVSVSIELYIDLTYEFADNKCTGSAKISLEIEVACFSETITIKATKKFAGAGSDPTFRELMDVQPDGTSEDWERYCAAFA